MNKLISLTLAVTLLHSCSQPIKRQEKIDFPATSAAPEWSKNATIYEVNLRQHTDEGTIVAFMEHLPAIKELGADILWLMPIYPISEKYRKANQTTLIEEVAPEDRAKYLGSYYAIKDYKALNPDLGTEEDFKRLVDKAHAMGMKVILDIAANHTGWDHNWITDHRDYYTRIEKGSTPWNPEWMKAHPEFYEDLITNQMTYPIEGGETDWWDTADLDYENNDMRNEMIEAMKYWVKEFDVDGYRCDVAMAVPTDFWEETRQQLDKIKPVFMLAEAEQADHLIYAFDMNYGWELHHIMNKISQGSMDVDNLRQYFKKYSEEYQPDDYRMNFITNHDENSWNGTLNERMPDSQKAMAVLMSTIPGMPLIYSGQETGLDKRLRFFEKDTIVWTETELRGFYTTLLQQKHRNEALWNGEYGGKLTEIETDNPTSIFALEREKNGARIISIINLSPETVNFNFTSDLNTSNMEDLFGGNSQELLSTTSIEMGPWQYIVLTNRP